MPIAPKIMSPAPIWPSVTRRPRTSRITPSSPTTSSSEPSVQRTPAVRYAPSPSATSARYSAVSSLHAGSIKLPSAMRSGAAMSAIAANLRENLRESESIGRQ